MRHRAGASSVGRGLAPVDVVLSVEVLDLEGESVFVVVDVDGFRADLVVDLQ